MLEKLKYSLKLMNIIVLEELKNYSRFVSKNSYLVVFDTTQGSFRSKKYKQNFQSIPI